MLCRGARLFTGLGLPPPHAKLLLTAGARLQFLMLQSLHSKSTLTNLLAGLYRKAMRTFEHASTLLYVLPDFPHRKSEPFAGRAGRVSVPSSWELLPTERKSTIA